MEAFYGAYINDEAVLHEGKQGLQQSRVVIIRTKISAFLQTEKAYVDIQ